MKIKTFNISDIYEIIPQRFYDERGYFTVSFEEKKFKNLSLPFTFVQDNESFSIKGTLRGLHFQKEPYTQGKLVRVIKGHVQDIIVDLRKTSPTFKQWKSFDLTAEQGNMIYVPEGFAHGFLALEDSIFSYKCTSYYNKSAESGIKWDDPELNIPWKLDNLGKHPIVSEKDQKLASFQEIYYN